jgi:O-antigen/teichoic acid export membrane protein
MSRQFAQEDLIGRRRLYRNTAHLIGGLVGLLSGLIFAIAEPFMAVWTRGQVPYDPWLIGCFLAAVILAVPGQSGFAMLRFTNHPRPLAISSACEVTIALVLCLLLVPRMGALGAALGLLIAEVLTFGSYLAVTGLRSLQTSVRPYFLRTYGVTAVACILSFAAAKGIALAWEPRGLLDLVVIGAGWAAIVTIPAAFVIFTRDQRSWILAQTRRGLTAIRGRKAP